MALERKLNARALRTRFGLLALLGSLLSATTLPVQAVDKPDFGVLTQVQAPVAPSRPLSAYDGETLSYRQYLPRDPRAVMVLVHAGGLHSALGYPELAYRLARDYRIAVITPDLRGHGASGGEPGDAPRNDAHFRDLDTILSHATVVVPDKPLFIGGHSSSSGLLLNYLGWTKRKDVRSLLMLAPYLGPVAKLDRRGDTPYVQLHKVGLITNKMSFGLLCRHCEGVTIPLPHTARINHRPLVEEFSVSSARPFVPAKPVLQVRKLRIPFGVWVGSKDELIQGGKTRQFFKANGREPWLMRNESVPGASHLSVLVETPDAIGAWLTEVLNRP